MTEIIHFAHGNGFPSLSYRQMLNHLPQRFSCTYIDCIGHNPRFPVTENWHFLVEEIAESIKNQADKPVIALGHSLGGVLSFRVAVEFPELVKAVIMLDAPIIGRVKSNLLRLSKALGMIDRITPAFRTRGRRQYWQTREQVEQYLRSKTLFNQFTNACLQDYIDYGMIKEEKGYTLRFDRDIEYQIYRTIPHMLYQYEGKLDIPAALIFGTKTNVVDWYDILYMKKQYAVSCQPISGTHMFPMEYPLKTAELITKMVDVILN